MLRGTFLVLTSEYFSSTMAKIVETEAATHTVPLLGELPALCGAGTSYKSFFSAHWHNFKQESKGGCCPELPNALQLKL